VPEDDHPRLRETPPHPAATPLLLAGVVDHGNPHATKLELEHIRQLGFRRVEVPPYRANGGVSRHLAEKRGIHQVAGVQDQICPLQVR
jgi:hypothetical protein